MGELYFIGMDMPQEVRNLVTSVTSRATNGMSENELMAYNLGVENTISAIITILNSLSKNEFAVNISGLDIPTEFDFADLEQHLMSLLEN